MMWRGFALASLLVAGGTPLLAQTSSTLLPCKGVFEGLGRAKGAKKPAEVFETMSKAWLAQSSKLAGKKLDRAVRLISGNEFLLLQTPEPAARALQGAIEQLRKHPSASYRMECTVVTLPAAAAKEQGLEPGKQKTADPAAAGKLFKAAVSAKGKLTNLQLSDVTALAPFVAKPGKKAARMSDEERQATSLDAILMPTGKKSVLLQVRAPDGSLRFLRLAKERGALLWLPCKDAAQAKVVWVRYIDRELAPASKKG